MEMESAEKQFSQKQHVRLVALMSLETMFPDPIVRSLAKSAGDGDIDAVNKLVENGVDVNVKGNQGATPLFWAMHNIDGFSRLLELGANPNVVFADGNNVVRTAVTMKDKRFIEETLKHGGNPNLVSSDSFGYTPIFDAFMIGEDMVDLLLSSGADINARDRFGNTPVLVAAERGNYEMVYHLLERGADFNVKNDHGLSLISIVEKDVGHLKAGSKWAKWHAAVVEWLSRARAQSQGQAERSRGQAEGVKP